MFNDFKYIVLFTVATVLWWSTDLSTGNLPEGFGLRRRLEDNISEEQTSLPSDSPSMTPTPFPTEAPTMTPTPFPTEAPTMTPTPFPTEAPMMPLPTVAPFPTDAPTRMPTQLPTNATSSPTLKPSDTPTESPTTEPTGWPTSSRCSMSDNINVTLRLQVTGMDPNCHEQRFAIADAVMMLLVSHNVKIDSGCNVFPNFTSSENCTEDYAPELDCKFLKVEGTWQNEATDHNAVTIDYDGVYEWQISASKWVNKRSDGEIVWRDLYSSWVIHSRNEDDALWAAVDSKMYMAKDCGVSKGDWPINPTKGNLTSWYFYDDIPTEAPTPKPSRMPTLMPTLSPTRNPTRMPTLRPTRNPTRMPTRAPSPRPTSKPTEIPTSPPSEFPTSAAPTVSTTSAPTETPTQPPTTYPTSTSTEPLTTYPPTEPPTTYPTSTISNSTEPPTFSPTTNPTNYPTPIPSNSPSEAPTLPPSASPTTSPSAMPVERRRDDADLANYHADCDVRPFPDSGTKIDITLKCFKDLHAAGYPQYGGTWQPSDPPTIGPTLRPVVSNESWPTVMPTTKPSPSPIPYPTYIPTLTPIDNTNNSDDSFIPTKIPTSTPSTAAPSMWNKYLLDSVLTDVIVSLPTGTLFDQNNLANLTALLEDPEFFGSNLTAELRRFSLLRNLELKLVGTTYSSPEVLLEYLGKIYITLIIIIVAIAMLGFHGLVLLFCTSNFKELIRKEGKSILFRECCCCEFCQCKLPSLDVDEDVEGDTNPKDKRKPELLTEAEQRRNFLKVMGTFCYVFWTCDTNMAYVEGENETSGEVKVLDDSRDKTMTF